MCNRDGDLRDASRRTDTVMRGRPMTTNNASVSADLVDDFAINLEDQLAELEQVTDDVLDHVERVNEIASAMMALIAGMRREVARARERRR